MLQAQLQLQAAGILPHAGLAFGGQLGSVNAAALAALGAARAAAQAQAAAHAQAKAKAKAALEAQNPIAPHIQQTPKPKSAAGLDISAISEALKGERQKLRAFIVKAKQEFDEKTGSATQEDGKMKYFSAHEGDLLGLKYKVLGKCLGTGAFSSVFRCVEQRDGAESAGATVAVKVIRADRMMRKAAEREAEMIREVRHASFDAKDGSHKNFVELLQEFDHGNHLCLAFECMKWNLREMLKAKAEKGRGLSIPLLGSVTKQLFMGLRLLESLQIVHCDLKPDNVLTDFSDPPVVKICDLGSANKASESFVTSYLGPRFYRAPEVILGCKWGCALDMWSLGCSIMELFTSKILFAGTTNNNMLQKMMEVLGPMPETLYKTGEYRTKHFTEEGCFVPASNGDIPSGDSAVVDRTRLRAITSIQQMVSAFSTDPLTRALVVEFGDLASRCLKLSPEERISPALALASHPFLLKA